MAIIALPFVFLLILGAVAIFKWWTLWLNIPLLVLLVGACMAFAFGTGYESGAENAEQYD